MLDVETLGAALKLVKEGGGGGGEGGAVIDDSKISPSTTWSSQKIVDTLCPPFTADGNPVTCTPVANYPLGVKASWEPHQEGEGDPSPENIRLIVGLDRVQVTRCGKNLLLKPYAGPSSVGGLDFAEQDDGSVIVNGTYNSQTTIMDYYLNSLVLTKGTYTVSGCPQNGSTYTYRILLVLKTEGQPDAYVSDIGKPQTFTLTTTTTVQAYIRVGYELGTVSNLVFFPQIEFGSTATAYEPYRGETIAIALGQTVYGGTLDAVTGEGSKEWRLFELNGETTINTVDELENTLRVSIPVTTFPSTGLFGYCNMFPWTFNYNFDSEHVYVNQAWLYLCVNKSRLSTIDIPGVLAYLTAQAAAGTPVQIAYKLATPTAFQATGGQSLPALPGTNTIYANAGAVTVSGLSDTVETFNALENRIAALEEAAISG